MTAPPLPPGWYPDPSGAPGKRFFDGREWTLYLADPPATPRAPITPWPSRRKMPPWGWMVIVVLAVVTAVISADVIGNGRQQAASPSATTSTVSTSASPPGAHPPSAVSPRSGLVAITLPRGSTPISGQAVPGLEEWQVPLRVPDTVGNLRSQLPINAPYEGLPWCGESFTLSEDITRWSWGTAHDLLLIEVGPFYPAVGARGPGSQVTITRHPDRTGSAC